MRRIAIALLIASITAAGCQKPAPPPESQQAGDPARNEPAAATPATDVADTHAPNEPGAASAAEPADATVTMRYRCDNGANVAIVRGDVARVTMSDARIIELKRVADSAPPRYSGAALSFDVDTAGATLGQDEAGGTACREAD